MTDLCILKSDEPLSVVYLKELSSKFGSIYLYPEKYKFNIDGISEISKTKMFGSHKLNWHKDMIHTDPWYAGTLLYCDTQGGVPTEFCYTMDTTYKNKAYTHGCSSGVTGLGDNELSRVFRLKNNKKLTKKISNFPHHLFENSPIIHPLYVEHPITKESCLTVSPATMTMKTGDREELVNDILSNNASWKHAWKRYDLILYDNYKLMHRRDSIISDNNRKLLRLNFNYEVLRTAT